MPPKRRAARSTHRARQQSLLDHFQPRSSSPTRPSMPKKARKPRRPRTPTPSDRDSEPEIVEIIPKTPSRSTGTQPTIYDSRTPHTSPLKQSRFINTPTSLRRSRKVNPLEVDVDASSDGSSSDIGHIKFEAKGKGKEKEVEVQVISDGDESDDGPPIGVQPSKRRRIAVESDDEEEGEQQELSPASDASDIEQPTKKRKSRLIRHTKDANSGSDNPSPKRLQKSAMSDASKHSEEEEDLSGIDEDQIVSSRLRKKRTKKTAKEKLLEKLKSKRTGQHVDLEDSDEEEGSEENASEEEAEVENNSDADVIPGARPDRAKKNKQSISEDEEDEDDFIDDEGADQSPTTALPSAFSMDVHQDVQHHFKIACQYFVHIAVTKAKKRARVSKELMSREDEYFSVPLSVLRRKLSSIRDTISSSVWRPQYTKALQKFPDFEVVIMDFAVPYCDACRLGGRKSKYVGRLTGQAYDSKTFEPVNKDDDSESDDSESERNGVSVEYHLGRYCARRTRIYHELTHWEHSVFTSLSREVCELSQRGHEGNFLQIGAPGRVEPPEDAKDADAIVEWLDQRKIIDQEWTRIKNLITQGSNIDVDARKEGGAED